MEGKSVNTDRRLRARSVLWITVIIILIAANLWVADKTFFTDPVNKLGGLKINPFRATTFVFANPAQKHAVSWENPKNILVLGRAGEGNNAPDLTDTIMVLHINPASAALKIKLISIPRDILIALTPERFLKINALWLYANQSEGGVEIVKEKIEELTALGINSVVVFDLETVRKIVAEIDGVTVSTEDIYDPRFPTMSGGYETFALQEGWRYLNAEQALRFIRTRHSPSGDFDRVKRQQQLLKAIKGKITSLNPVWNFPTLWSIFSIVKEEIATDLTAEDARNLWLVSNQVGLDEIETLSIDVASGLVVPKTIQINGEAAYTLVATEEPFDYRNIQEAIADFINH